MWRVIVISDYKPQTSPGSRIVVVKTIHLRWGRRSRTVVENSSFDPRSLIPWVANEVLNKRTCSLAHVIQMAPSGTKLMLNRIEKIFAAHQAVLNSIQCILFFLLYKDSDH